MKHIETDAQTIRPARRPALHEHIGTISELQQAVQGGRRLEIELDAALTAIENRHGGRLMHPTRIPAGWLDPHYVRPVVRQQPRGPGARHPARAIQHPKPFDGSRHVLPPKFTRSTPHAPRYGPTPDYRPRFQQPPAVPASRPPGQDRRPAIRVRLVRRPAATGRARPGAAGSRNQNRRPYGGSREACPRRL